MAPKVEQISNDLLILGEGPHWDVASQSLYLVDCYGPHIIKYVPSTGSWNKARIYGRASIIIPVEGTTDKFVITSGPKIYLATWDGVSSQVSRAEILAEVDQDIPETPFNVINDGKADPTGRLWVGTHNFAPLDRSEHPVGSLYSLISKNRTKKHFSNIAIANGLAWDTKLNKFYYIDSFTYRIDSYDVNLQKGEISNKKTAFSLTENNIPGTCDGMTIDSEGKLWVAIFGGSRVIRIDPVTSKLLTTVEIPTPEVASLAFGGPNLDELYVVTGSVANENYSVKPGPPGGATFRVTGLGVRGLPADNVKL